MLKISFWVYFILCLVTVFLFMLLQCYLFIVFFCFLSAFCCCRFSVRFCDFTMRWWLALFCLGLILLFRFLTVLLIMGFLLMCKKEMGTIQLFVMFWDKLKKWRVNCQASPFFGVSFVSKRDIDLVINSNKLLKSSRIVDRISSYLNSNQ